MNRGDIWRGFDDRAMTGAESALLATARLHADDAVVPALEAEWMLHVRGASS